MRQNLQSLQISRKSFNPRTPCGVRQAYKDYVVKSSSFQSTHSLRSATDAGHIPVADGCGFNPRTPCGVRQIKQISFLELSGFNPRTPCGVRHCGPGPTAPRAKFQSTHSLRSATREFDNQGSVLIVSIHALLAECDRYSVKLHSSKGALFQSTHSLRSATSQNPNQKDKDNVSIHALLAECDR